MSFPRGKLRNPRINEENYCPLSFFFSLMTTYAVAELSDEQVRDRPLELGDIMPEDRRLYDKMRPPKYKGNINSVHDLKPLNMANKLIFYDTVEENCHSQKLHLQI